MKQLAHVNHVNSRKRSVSMSSTTTVSSEESVCTNSKQRRLDVEDLLTDCDNLDIFLD